MENFNILILIGICISSIVSLAIELEDTHTIKYEIQLRLFFCCTTIGSIHSAFNDTVGANILLNSSIFLFLLVRMITRLKQLGIIFKHTPHDYHSTSN